MQKPQLKPTPDQTFELIGSGDFDFVKVLADARRMQEQGEVERACNHRFQAFQRLMDFLPEDEEVILEWNHRNSRAVLELLHASADPEILVVPREKTPTGAAARGNQIGRASCRERV